MSKHVVECTRCHKHWNIKHNGDNCPKCGWYRYTSDTPPTPEALVALREHFRRP